MKRITRNRPLTPEEVIKYNKIRELIAQEYPPIPQFNEEVKKFLENRHWMRVYCPSSETPYMIYYKEMVYDHYNNTPDQLICGFVEFDTLHQWLLALSRGGIYDK